MNDSAIQEVAKALNKQPYLHMELPGDVFGLSDPWVNLVLFEQKDWYHDICLYNENWSMIRWLRLPVNQQDAGLLYQQRRMEQFQRRRSQMQTQERSKHVVELPSSLFWNIRQRPGEKSDRPEKDNPQHVLLMQTDTDVYVEYYSRYYDYIGSMRFPYDISSHVENELQHMMKLCTLLNLPHEKKMESQEKYYPHKRHGLIPTVQVHFPNLSCIVHLVYQDDGTVDGFEEFPNGRIQPMRKIGPIRHYRYSFPLSDIDRPILEDGCASVLKGGPFIGETDI